MDLSFESKYDDERDFKVSKTDIGEIKRRTRGKGIAMTIPNLVLAFENTKERIDEANGKIKLTKATLVLKFSIEIVMPFVPDCAYKVIFEHEMKHVKDYELIFTEFAAELEKDKAIMATLSSFFRWCTIAEMVGIHAKTKNQVNKKFRADVESTNSSLDTPEEYADVYRKIRRSCYFEIDRVLSPIFSPYLKVLDSATFGLLSKRMGKRVGTDPRTTKSKANHRQEKF